MTAAATASAAYKPRSLAKEGGDFWKKVTSKYTLRVDELVTLESACQTLDLVVVMHKDWVKRGRPTTATGSQGQVIAHPLIGEMKAQRLAFEAFVKRLDLPDDVPGIKPNQNRTAGNSRWDKAHGTGA